MWNVEDLWSPPLPSFRCVGQCREHFRCTDQEFLDIQCGDWEESQGQVEFRQWQDASAFVRSIAYCCATFSITSTAIDGNALVWSSVQDSTRICFL